MKVVLFQLAENASCVPSGEKADDSTWSVFRSLCMPSVMRPCEVQSPGAPDDGTTEVRSSSSVCPASSPSEAVTSSERPSGDQVGRLTATSRSAMHSGAALVASSRAKQTS